MSELRDLPVIETAEVFELLKNSKLGSIVDVRAPVEFAAGSIPGAINLPILTDVERAQVGTVYKQQGQTHAIELGHGLVAGEVKAARIRAWIGALQNQPQPIITCFRGGLRSQLTQAWLRDAGLSVRRVRGGYKKMRAELLNVINTWPAQNQLWVLSGATGTGKSKLLRDVRATVPILDLELMARHRGSAFGGMDSPQPAQADFENQLALGCMQAHGTVLVEDESRLIGRCVQPDIFFEALRASPVLLLEEPLQTRVQNTFVEYVLNQSSDPKLFTKLQTSLQKISKKLGGLRYTELQQILQKCERDFVQHKDLSENVIWIERLLVWYYDPLYKHSWERRDPKVLIRGNAEHIKEFLGTRSTKDRA